MGAGLELPGVREGSPGPAEALALTGEARPVQRGPRSHHR